MRAFAAATILSSVVGLGACTMPELDALRAPDPSTLFRPLSVTNLKESRLPPVAPEDMVDQSGRCAAAMMAPGEASGDATAPQANIPLIPAAIALDMTECEVVKRAGPPEKVDIGANDRSERTAVLTYIRGSKPGIYHFTAGRLTSMERAPEPPPKSARPARRVPKPKRS